MGLSKVLASLEAGDALTQIRNGQTTVTTVTDVQTIDGVTIVDMEPEVTHGR